MREDDILIEKNRSIMEDIWKRIPKETQLPQSLKGEYILYIATDPKYLYMTGFVDTKRYTEEEWIQAFQDSLQNDGTYLISKEKFIRLGKYKYTGPIRKPLDAMKIREGWYDSTQWHEFLVKSVIPSTTIPPETLVQIEKEMKKTGRYVNGRIQIDKSVKLNIKNLIENYPSPARRREVGVEEAYQKLLEKEAQRSKSPVQEKSKYQSGKKLGEEQKKNLTNVLMKTTHKTMTDEPQNTISIKDLQKKSKTKKK